MASTVTELLRRRFGGKSLPYDAEIEYLQNTGTQFIDTGIKGNLNTHIEISFRVTNYAGFACGSRGNNTNDITIYCGSGNSTNRFGNKSATFNFTLATKYNASLDKSKLTINGNAYTINATTDFTTPTNIYVMHAGTSMNGGSRCYYFKMYQDNILVRDMIPVRKGTTGYMYDKVSGQLFGNAGSGDFILGNDK